MLLNFIDVAGRVWYLDFLLVESWVVAVVIELWFDLLC